MCGSDIVRFARSTGPGHRGFGGSLAALADLEPDWLGPRDRLDGEWDVTEIVPLVFER